MGKQQNVHRDDHDHNYHNGHHYSQYGRLKAMKKRSKAPIKIRYISNPVMVKASNAFEFRAIVQKLTGQGPQSIKTTGYCSSFSSTTTNKINYLKEIDDEITTPNYAKMDMSRNNIDIAGNNMLLDSSATTSGTTSSPAAGFQESEFWGRVLLSKSFSGLIKDPILYDEVDDF